MNCHKLVSFHCKNCDNIVVFLLQKVYKKINNNILKVKSSLIKIYILFNKNAFLLINSKKNIYVLVKLM